MGAVSLVTKPGATGVPPVPRTALVDETRVPDLTAPLVLHQADGPHQQREVDVVTYQYMCDQDGLTEVNRPMGTAPRWTPCPVCRQPARRRFTGPMVASGDEHARRLIESTAATSDRPEVVTAIPPPGGMARHPSAPPHRLLSRLPRP